MLQAGYELERKCLHFMQIVIAYLFKNLQLKTITEHAYTII